MLLLTIREKMDSVKCQLKVDREEVKLKTKRWIISLTCFTFVNCGQTLATFITVCLLAFTKRNELHYLNFFAMIYLFGKVTVSLTLIIPTAIQLFSDVRGALYRIEMFLKATEYSQSRGFRQEPARFSQRNKILFRIFTVSLFT